LIAASEDSKHRCPVGVPLYQSASEPLKMSVSVIVCTYNRWKLLAAALASLAVSTLPTSFEWEVIVVDNNSADKTREVVEDFCQRYPRRFRYVSEVQQGVSHARNAGIRESRGDVVAFMDDDVTVGPEWLWNLTAALHTGEWTGAGGRIIPVWHGDPPKWLPIERLQLSGPFVAFDLGSEPGPLAEPPFGANMAFRKEAFEKYGGFRTDLGRRANSLLSNEDTEFGRRLLKSGERLRYEPSAVMLHPVYENRLQKKYLLAWWFAKGRADIAELGVQPETKWFLAGIPLYLFRRLTAWTLRWLIATNAARRFSCKMSVWNIAGQISECYQHSPRANRRTEAFVENQGAALLRKKC
jgi:glucosyl-dolichyl phosphate glucuronosyltransferase